jgi:hypothetical protein
MSARRDASDVTRLLRQKTTCNGRSANRGDRSFGSSGYSDLILCRTLAFAFTRPGTATVPPEVEPTEYNGGGVINNSTNFIYGGYPGTIDFSITWTGGDPSGCTPTQCW